MSIETGATAAPVVPDRSPSRLARSTSFRSRSANASTVCCPSYRARSNRRSTARWTRRRQRLEQGKRDKGGRGDGQRVLVRHRGEERLQRDDVQARALVDMFNKNFAKFEVHVDADVRAAAPALRQAAE